MNDENISELENDLEKSLTDLGNLKKSKLKRKNNEIKENIKHFVQMTDRLEERRSKILNFAAQYLVLLISAMGLSIAIKVHISKHIFLTLIFCFGSQVLFTFILLIIYIFQSYYKYPFTEYGRYANQWKWFYKGNEHITKIDRNIFNKSKQLEKTKIPYLKGLNFFITNYATETLHDEIKSNAIQLFLLQVHNYYKNQFYLALINIQKIGILVISSIILISLSLYIVLITIHFFATISIIIFYFLHLYL